MKAIFQLGQSYTREYIKDVLGCEGDGYLPHRAGKVVCCNVTLRYNPDAPDIILPGTGNGIDYWAEVLCKQGDAIPVFIKERDAYLWHYVGDYEVDRWTADANEIANQKKRSKRPDTISRVIFLKRNESILITKPATVQKQFNPSQRQQTVYDFQKNQSGNLFIDAVAGSGKTTTLVWLAEKWLDDNPISSGRALFVAFNKSIANELESRFPPAIKAKTIHSVGLDALRRTEKKSEPKLDDSKYLNLAIEFLSSCGIEHDQSLAKAIERLVHFVMVTLTDPNDEAKLVELLLHYGIEVDEDALSLVAKAVPHLIYCGITTKDSIISYDDMLYLPCVLDVPIPQYEMLYCDEAQDLSAAQLKLIKMLRAHDGRIFFVGDPHQAIYGFAGADSNSVETIIETTKAEKLPLDVSYRCPHTHINLAQMIVPHIKAKPDAEEGIVELISEEAFFNDHGVRVQQGDLVICRTSLPLINAVLQLKSTGMSAQVRGNNTADEWIGIVDTIVKRYGWQDFRDKLIKYHNDHIGLLRRMNASQLEIVTFTDKIRCVSRIYAQCVRSNHNIVLSDLKSAIKDLFTDNPDTDNVILLSTVHRAKGLESKRVFILRQELMPHPNAKTAEEIHQEWNLRYVALTRAKKALYFVITPKRKKADIVSINDDMDRFSTETTSDS